MHRALSQPPVASLYFRFTQDDSARSKRDISGSEHSGQERKRFNRNTEWRQPALVSFCAAALHSLGGFGGRFGLQGHFLEDWTSISGVAGIAS